jgi:hypothetical protein
VAITLIGAKGTATGDEKLARAVESQGTPRRSKAKHQEFP